MLAVLLLMLLLWRLACFILATCLVTSSECPLPTPHFLPTLLTTIPAARLFSLLAPEQDPNEILHKYGADALRLYLINSPVVRAEPLRFKVWGFGVWDLKIWMGGGGS